MTRLEFIRLILGNLKLLIFVPLLMAVIVFLLTMNAQRMYKSKSLIYTGLVSGYDIESSGKTSIDYFAVKNAFDNLINTIKSRKTLEEVAIQLLAERLVDEVNQPEKTQYIVDESLTTLTPKQLNNWVDPVSVQRTTENLTNALNTAEDENLKDIIYASSGFYSVTSLKSVNATRQANSDMLELSYNSADPKICQRTLQILINVFFKRFKSLKEGETGTVLKYFQSETRKAFEKLKQAEENLRQFREEYNIVNYNEQTKSVSMQQKDIEAEYRAELQKFAAAKASFAKIESKMDIRKELLTKSEQVVTKRKRLSKIMTEIALAEINKSDKVSVQELLNNANQIRHDLQNLVGELYQLNHSTEGLPKKDLLQEWLTKLLEIDEAESRLEVIKNRMGYAQKSLEFFAPLGSKLKRLERAVNIAEREYLELLHSLNMSKLRQQNLQIASNLKILDQPNFPLHPEQSKRKLLIAGSLMVGFMSILGLIIAMEYFDDTLKSPKRAAVRTGLKLAGALPLFYKNDPKVNYKALMDQSLDMIINKIHLELNNNQSAYAPFLITIFSFGSHEGKTSFALLLRERLKEMNNKVFCLAPSMDELVNGKLHGKNQKLETNNGIVIKSLLNDKKALEDKMKIIILELQDLRRFQMPMKIMKNTEVGILITRANRNWTYADQHSLNNIKEALVRAPLLVVNGVDLSRLEEIFGEIPKKRSGIRKFVKKIVMYDSPFRAGKKS